MSLKIMIVEDDEALLEVLAEFFESLDFSVITAKDGLDAIDKFNEHKVDIIVSDIEMPKVTGIDLLKYFSSLAVSAPAIFLMSGNSPVSIKDLSSMGASGFFEKPFDLDKISNILLAMKRTG